MNMNKRETVLIVLLLLVGLGYLYYSYVYEPLQVELSKVQTDNQNLQGEIDKLKKLQAQKKDNGNGTDSVNQIKSEFAELCKKVPTYAMIPEALVFLETSAKDSGISMVSVNVSDPGGAVPANPSNSNTGAPISQTFQMNGSGGYFAMISFLQKVEECPRIYVLQSIAIGSSPNQSATATPAPATTTTGTATPATQTYDGTNLAFQISFSSLYDQIELEGIGATIETVQPAPGRNNPFSS